MLKSMPALILIKTVFDVEKCLAYVRLGVNFLLSEYCSFFFKCKQFLQLAVLNYDDW